MKKTLFRRIWNRILAKFARALPGGKNLRPWLHRLRGVQINGKVYIGDDVYIENEYPECVRLEEGAQINLRSVIIAHTRGIGSVVVERNVLVGACSLIIAPVGATLTIGAGAVVGAGSVITGDVPAQTLVAPERVKAYARVTVPLTMTADYNEFRRGLRPLVAPRKPSV
jgi:acetyltransferase-like isoleucine patch superfamily enzyme